MIPYCPRISKISPIAMGRPVAASIVAAAPSSLAAGARDANGDGVRFIMY